MSLRYSDAGIHLSEAMFQRQVCYVIFQMRRLANVEAMSIYTGIL